MSKVIEGLYYSKNHEWVKVEGSTATVGITDHAQNEMGDVVYVDCGVAAAEVSAGDAIAVVESVKAASDVYAPVSGTVTEVNEALTDAPETVNADAFGTFLFKIEMSDSGELSQLMDAGAYSAYCAG